MWREEEIAEQLSGLPQMSVPMAGRATSTVPDLMWRGQAVNIRSRRLPGSGTSELELTLRKRNGLEETWNVPAFRKMVAIVDEEAARAISSDFDPVVWAATNGGRVLERLEGRRDARSTKLRQAISILRSPLHRRTNESPDEPEPGQILRIWHVAWLLGPRVTVEEVRKLRKIGLIIGEQERPNALLKFKNYEVARFLTEHGNRLGYHQARFDEWMKQSEI